MLTTLATLAVLVPAVLALPPRAHQLPVTLLAKGAQGKLGQDVTVGGTAVSARVGPDGTLVVTMDPASTAQPWEAAMHAPSQAPIKQNDVVQIRAKIRSRTQTRISFHYELTRAPNTKFLSAAVTPGPAWQEVRFANRADRDYAPGEARLAVFLAHGKGVVEFADLEVLNHGPGDPRTYRSPVDVFGGVPNPDSWKAPALEYIEKHRKGNLAVKVVDAAGKPIENAIVRFDQLRHDFRFGTAGPARLLNEDSENAAKYREVVERLFNTFTFENDLKWFSLEPDYGQVDQAIEWLAERDFKIRGHCLVWGSAGNLPRGLLDQPEPQLRTVLQERVEKTVKRFEDKVYLWDVVNEAVTENELWNRLGWNTFQDTFRWVKRTSPKTLTCYNDFNWTEENQAGPSHRLRAIKIVEDAIKAGTPIDVIGLQCHIGVPLTPMKRVREIVDRIASWNRPIEVTEFDIGGVDDPKMMADYLEDYLTAMFGHPKVDAFILWGFWEGSHWRSREGAALFQADWTPTPSAQRWEELVKKRWWSSSVKRTDRTGQAGMRAFYGKHKVVVEANGKTLTEVVSTPKGRDVTITLVVR